ncbi:TetR/AcrR family transcriptional regulator [Streptomyces sp. DSM 44915]|uniref:TetR/AcrR family transcriptional regulator n=1 Tax=Streptomyces chisholmiae TaxID=3075540 RepID=A0ABU2JLJ8_9ACTN|nr:TetR/AcrR family transcriptional regulator [Streptomyces sp. DSM 44915]MDT0265860.1 TetR/AcrR family transcriptional regulator [Streptomyces sp. DSM 44915]
MPSRARTERRGGQTFIEAARRDQIVAGAIAVLAEEGYGGASFARIARRVGISPGLISYHFANKEDLVGAVVAQVTEALEAAIADRTGAASDHHAALRAMVEAQVEFFAAHPSEVNALGTIRNNARDTATGAKAALAHRAAATARLERFFRDGQAAGDFAPGDARLLAVTTIGALEAVPLELATRPETDPAHYGRELATLLARTAGAGAGGVPNGVGFHGGHDA